MKKWLTNRFSVWNTRSQGTQTVAIALPSSPCRWTRAKTNSANTGIAPPYNLRHRCNLTSVSKVCKAGPQRTQRITGSACQISFHPDWQIDNGFFRKPIMTHTQILVHKWRPKAVSHTDLTRDDFRLWRRLPTVVTFTMRPSTKWCPSLSSGLAGNNQ